MRHVLVPSAEDDTRVERLHELLTVAAARWPAAPAVRDACGVWSYAELLSESARVAAWLSGRGVAAGDRVVVEMTTTRHTVATVYGCSIAGAVAVPIDPRVTGYQAAHVVADASPALVIGDKAGREALSGPPGWRPAAVSDRSAAGPPSRAPQTAAVDIAFLLYTSGSTATPKAVVAPHRAVLYAARAIQQMLRYRPSDIVACRIPLAFDYGLYQLLLCALSGAELVLADPSRDARLLADIRDARASVVPLVPSLATMLVQLSGRDTAPTDIRLFTNTGDTLPGRTIAQLRRRFPGASWQLMYGLTECKRVSIMEPDHDLVRPHAVGRPLPGTWVRVVDDDGVAVPAGVSGEVVVGGPHVMAGYWNAPALTARVFSGGELRTGDFGRLDVDGYLYLEGRRDGIFKRNGVRTSTAELEAAARDIPGVGGAVVFPPADGRDSILCVVGAVPAVEVLRAMRERLEPAKVPGICRVLPTFPLNRNGKIDRSAVLRLATEDHR